MASKKSETKTKGEAATPAVSAAKRAKAGTASQAGAPSPKSAVRVEADIVQGKLAIDPNSGLIALQVGPDVYIPLAEIVKLGAGSLQLVIELTSSIPNAASYADAPVLAELQKFLALYAKAGIFGSVTTGRPKPPPKSPKR